MIELVLKRNNMLNSLSILETNVLYKNFRCISSVRFLHSNKLR